ncbi:MAG: TolC family protein [Bacteroidales bacterium]|nr:TolC family protein [Bacteroidales bacterium]MDD4067338.1 TolC family protein [Bacteroidales bacterium]MDY4790192.1 TolC family protein [Bacteroidales bacterium]
MKIKILKLTILSLSLAFVNINVLGQESVLKLDLETALRIAHDNNPTIKIADIEIQRVDYAKKEAIGALLPSLNAVGQYTDNVMKQVMFMPESFSALMGGQKYMEMGYKNSYNGVLSTQIPIVNFTLWQNIKNKQNDIDIIIEKSRASKIEMTKQVKDAYYGVLLSKSSLKVLEQSHKNALETLKNIENSYKQGVVSEYDFIRAQVNVNNLNPILINAKNGVDLAIMQLRMILSLPAEQNIETQETLESFNKNISLFSQIDKETALTQNSDLKILDYNITGLENQLKLINTQHLPMLSASGNYIYQTQSEDFNFKEYNWVSSASIGLQLTVPLFSGMQKVNQAKQVKMAIKGLQLQREYAKDGINLQIQAAINQMKAAKEQLNVNKDAIKQAERGYEIAKVRYQVGSGTILELNDSELSLTQSSLNYQQSLYNFLSAQANVEKIMGNIK